ncbi:hypothetical protein [Streptomyces collinus]|uniref:hypothetical protein n=1 Tax=Streptomyces collinus TaxID=42684 RepID=UPI00363738DD
MAERERGPETQRGWGPVREDDLLRGLAVDDRQPERPVLLDRDGRPIETWRENHPYEHRIGRPEYERTKRILQIELLKLQRWVKQYEQFLLQAPLFERLLTDDGALLVKFWFSVSRAEQRTRFAIRQVDPVRRWKLSPTDLASLDRWDDYTAAKVDMFRATDTAHAPWTVVKNNDKRRGRLEAMRSLLYRFDYPARDATAVGTPDPLIVGAADTLLEPGEEPTALSPTPLAGPGDGPGNHPDPR